MKVYSKRSRSDVALLNIHLLFHPLYYTLNWSDVKYYHIQLTLIIMKHRSLFKILFNCSMIYKRLYKTSKKLISISRTAIIHPPKSSDVIPRYYGNLIMQLSFLGLSRDRFALYDEWLRVPGNHAWLLSWAFVTTNRTLYANEYKLGQHIYRYTLQVYCTCEEVCDM